MTGRLTVSKIAFFLAIGTILILQAILKKHFLGLPL